MVKVPASWTSSGGSVAQTGNGSLLLESGDNLLLEDGLSFLLLEDVTFAPKEQTAWDANTTKRADIWAGDGFTTYSQANAGVQRTLQDGTIRTLQDGTIRLLQENAPVSKASTKWDNV